MVSNFHLQYLRYVYHGRKLYWKRNGDGVGNGDEVGMGIGIERTFLLL